MRRITLVLGACAVAAAAAAIAAGGGSAKTDRARGLPGRFHQMVLPGVGHIVIPSVQGDACFISSTDQKCSLTPCTGFVAGSPDWVPITSQCRRNGPGTLVRVGPRGLPLLMGAGPHLPRLVSRPR